MRILILGASGYGGGELLRLLHGHPHVEAVRGTSRQYVGQPFSACHPNLRCLKGTFDAEPDWAWLAESERPVLFAAMPHGAFAAQYVELEHGWRDAGLDGRLTVVDLSADFRLGTPARYAHHYGQPHAAPEALASFCYPIPELDRPKLPGAQRIANPGCFATACQLVLAPFERTSTPAFVALSAITGSSGSGASPSDTTHHPTRAHDFRAYKALRHQHLGEIEQRLEGSRLDVSLVTHSAPLVRGIFVTAQAQLPRSADAQAVAQELHDLCDGEPFLDLVEGSPRVASVVGTNRVEMTAVVEGRTVAVMAALDNLVKGMAGQAIQNLNVALGFDESAGLTAPGLYPG